MYRAPFDTALHRLGQETDAGLLFTVACFAAKVTAKKSQAPHIACRQDVAASNSNLRSCSCQIIVLLHMQMQSTYRYCHADRCNLVCCQDHSTASAYQPIGPQRCQQHLLKQHVALFSRCPPANNAFTPKTSLRMVPQQSGLMSSQDAPSVYACYLTQQAMTPCQLCRSCCHHLRQCVCHSDSMLLALTPTGAVGPATAVIFPAGIHHLCPDSHSPSSHSRK